jgi:hypothetical protein
MTKQPRIVYSRNIRHKAKRNPIAIVVPLVSLGLFIWLAIAAQAHSEQSSSAHGSASHGYSAEDRQAMQRLVMRETAKPTHDSKRAAIMDIWNISENDLAKPVKLW